MAGSMTDLYGIHTNNAPESYISPRRAICTVEKDGKSGVGGASYIQRKLVLEIMVMSQLAQDLMTEFRNLPEIKERFRYECSQFCEVFNQMRKRLKRTLPSKAFEDFENDICDIVDGCDENVEWVRNMIATEMTNKIPYDKIKSATLIGMIGGLIDIIRTVHSRINGKRNMEYDKIYGYLKYIDDRMCFKPMNQGVDINFASCNDAMTKMFIQIGEKIDQFLKKQDYEIR